MEGTRGAHAHGRAGTERCREIYGLDCRRLGGWGEAERSLRKGSRNGDRSLDEGGEKDAWTKRRTTDLNPAKKREANNKGLENRPWKRAEKTGSERAAEGGEGTRSHLSERKMG